METSTLSQFIELLGKDDRGFTWLINLADSMALKRTSPESALKLLKAAHALHLESTGKGGLPESAETARLSLWTAVRNSDFSAANKERKSVSNEVHRCGHISDLRCLREHHFDIEELLTEHYHDDENRDRGLSDVDIEEVMRALASGKRSVKLKSGARLGVSRVWLSPYIGGQLAFATPLATQIRDKLGLIHYKEDDYLVEYRVNSVDGRSAWAPTPLDGMGTRFRAMPDNAPAAGRWGMTVDLRLFADQMENMDGAKEAVVPPIPLDESHARTLRPLGSLIDERGLTAQDDDSRFAKRLLGKRDASAIVGGILETVRIR